VRDITRFAVVVLAFGICGLPVAAEHGQTSAKPPADSWAALRYLVGTWEGTAEGQPGTGTVRREYRFVLRDRFIEVRNTSTYPAQQKNPKGEVHEDVGYISYDRSRQRFVLRQFHVEGFVNQYVAQAPSSARLVFTSEAIENIAPGWRARETYTYQLPDGFEETFELAEPGKDFEVYTHSRFKRVR
jgi:hypothetical protein